ncbi:MAG: hypothetical protein H6618_05305 [Deltaproteobacteria bacterium]|nr:hypothetical protein [Deltaproteobacteria bacterium]
MTHKDHSFFSSFSAVMRLISEKRTARELKEYESLSAELIAEYTDLSDRGGCIYLKYIQTELLYTLLRHELWLGNEYFRTVFIQMVGNMCRVPQDQATQIAEGLLACAYDWQEGGGERPVLFASDEEFVLYAYTQVLSAGPSAQDSDLSGFGPLFREKLIRMTDVCSRILSRKQDLAFSYDDQDLIFLKALQKLSAMRARWPWYLDVLELRYRLGGLSPEWSDYLCDEQQSDLVLKLLTDAGLKAFDAGMFVAEWCRKTKPSFHQLDPAELLLELRSQDLIWFPDFDEKEKRQPERRRLELTEAGFRLTSGFFSGACFESFSPLKALEPGQSPYWQCAWVRRCLDSDKDLRDALLSEALSRRALPSGVPELICEEMVRIGRVQELESWLKRLYQASLNPTMKLRLWELMAKESMPESSRNLFRQLMKNDPSHRVRNQLRSLS